MKWSSFHGFVWCAVLYTRAHLYLPPHPLSSSSFWSSLCLGRCTALAVFFSKRWSLLLAVLSQSLTQTRWRAVDGADQEEEGPTTTTTTSHNHHHREGSSTRGAPHKQQQLKTIGSKYLLCCGRGLGWRRFLAQPKGQVLSTSTVPK